jgi:hypothetical protein
MQITYLIDDIKVSYDPASFHKVEGSTIQGVTNMTGNQLKISMVRRSFKLNLLYVLWKNGEKDIRALVIRGNQKIMTLHNRVRLSIEDYSAPGEKTKFYTCALRQLRLTKTNTYHSNLCDATMEELDDGSGFDTKQTLKNFGALKVGTKEKLFGDEGRARNRNWVIFKKDNYDVPIIVFLMTRILPAYNSIFK